MRLIDADALLNAEKYHKCGIPFTFEELITNAPAIEQGEPVAEYLHEPHTLNYGVKWLIDYKLPHGTKLFIHSPQLAKRVKELETENAKLREALEYADRLIPYNHIITASLAKDKQ